MSLILSNISIFQKYYKNCTYNLPFMERNARIQIQFSHGVYFSKLICSLHIRHSIPFVFSFQFLSSCRRHTHTHKHTSIQLLFLETHAHTFNYTHHSTLNQSNDKWSLFSELQPTSLAYGSNTIVSLLIFVFSFAHHLSDKAHNSHSANTFRILIASMEATAF